MHWLRKRFVVLTLTGAALALASCAPLTPLVVTQGPPARAPDGLTRSCDGPGALPQGGLNAGQVARLWGRDRVNLAACRGRHGALAAHVRAQEAAGSGVVHPPFSMGERGSGP
jgi:hypothetical protein